MRRSFVVSQWHLDRKVFRMDAKCDFVAGCPNRPLKIATLVGKDGKPQLKTAICRICLKELEEVAKEAKGRLEFSKPC